MNGMHGSLEVEDPATGKALATLDGEFSPVTNLAQFSPDGSRVLVWDFGRDKARVYQRRRPEQWWGVFCLTEFWVTVAFAGLFVWCVVRDRRALGPGVVPDTGAAGGRARPPQLEEVP